MDMMAQTQNKNYTLEEYLALELESDIRHEYRNGEIVPMTGGTPRHNCISGNLYIALRLAFKHQPYDTFH
jgi:Uma2 family endonuclease